MLAERGHTAILVATSAAEKGLVEGLPPALCIRVAYSEIIMIRGDMADTIT